MPAEYTVKKVRGFPVPSRDVIYQTLVGNNLIISARESLVSDITAGDGKTAKLFLQLCPSLTTTTLLFSLSVDVLVKDDVTVILLLSVSFKVGKK